LRRLLLGLAGAMFVLAASAREPDLVLGMSAPFTGTEQGLGIELYRGAAAYFAEVNRRGGVSGTPLVVKAYDDGYDPSRTVANTINLIERDRAFLLFGFVGTPTVIRVLPLLLAQENRTFELFFPFTGAPTVRRAPYEEVVFNLRASYRDETAGLVANLLAVGRRKIGIFYQSDAFGRSGWDGVRRALADNGLRMVGEATYRRGTTTEQSLGQQVAILQKAGADAVVSIATYTASAAFIRDARDAGWRVPIANVSFVGSEHLSALLQEESRRSGRDYTVDLINSQVVPSFEDTSLPAVREYRELMARHDPRPPSFAAADYRPLAHSHIGLEGFLDAKLLVEILERLDGILIRQRLRDAAESVRDFDLGIDVKASFGPRRHGAMSRVYYTTIRDGRTVPITSWNQWKH
jgi:ABC-type branched-subunit amino acid transport system substrate-binding protein